jgi:hypothetical protein
MKLDYGRGEAHSRRAWPSKSSTRIRWRVWIVIFAWGASSDAAVAKEILAENSDSSTEADLMTPSARSALHDCVSQAAQVAGDEKDRHVMVGVYIGSQGKPVSLALLESSGLEQLDKLVLRCIVHANYLPAAAHQPPLHWVFTTSFKGKQISPNGEIAHVRELASKRQTPCA